MFGFWKVMDLATEKSWLLLHSALVWLWVILVCVFYSLSLQCLGQAVLSLSVQLLWEARVTKHFHLQSHSQSFSKKEKSRMEEEKGWKTVPSQWTLNQREGLWTSRAPPWVVSPRQFCSLPSLYNEYVVGIYSKDVTVEHKPQTSTQVLAVHWANGIAESPHSFIEVQRKQDQPGWN